MRHPRVPLFFVLMSLLALQGCASGPSPVAETFAALWAQRQDADAHLPVKPDPRYLYLRVEQVGSVPAMMVLGYVDPHPQGDIEVWYSAQQQMLKTQNGRIVGTGGLATDWTNVRFSPAPPAWQTMGTTRMRYERTRDEMPAYTFGLSEQLTLTPWAGVPDITLPAALPESKARKYQWFGETVAPGSARESTQVLPTAWYAWGRHRGVNTVVYSQQCVAPTVCLRMLRWPVQEEEF